MSEAYDINLFDVSVGVSTAAFEPRYFRAARWSPGGRATDLGTLPGGNASTARSIDALGFVAGDSNAGTGDGVSATRAVVWDPLGRIHQLAVPPDTTSSTASRVGPTAIVIGRADAPAHRYALRWNAFGKLTVLPDVPGTAGSVANALNAAGVVVGASVVGAARSPGVAVRWSTTGRLQVLDAPAGATSSVATGVNDSGTAVGTGSFAGEETRAVRWDSRGHVHSLGTLPGGDRSTASAVNGRGTVIGASNSTPGGPLVAVMWDSFGRIIPLATLGAGSTVVDINERGYMAGYVQPTDAVLPVAARWSPSGALTRLGVFAGGDEDGIGTAIAPDNTVAGYASDPNEDNHAVLWRPAGCGR